MDKNEIKVSRSDLVQLTMDLVRLPTVNAPPNGQELVGQIYIEKLMREIGLDVHRVYPEIIRADVNNGAFLADRSFEDRFCVVGIWHGTGGGRSLLLSGHMDVTPPEPLAWKHCDPFKPVTDGTVIYGRGTADMKGGLAAMLTAVKVLKESGFAPSGDVLLESVVDEEYAGANGTIADRLAGYNADFAVNAEPTGLVICPACVGAHILKITVQGKAGMPYTGEAIYNPVYGITRVIDILSDYERELADHEVCHPLWQNSPQRDRAVIITKLSAGETGEHGQLGTPIDAWTEVIIQTYPGEESEESFNRFKDFFDRRIQDSQELQNKSITIDREYRYVEPYSCGVDHDGVKALIGCVEKALGKLPKVYGAPFSCDLAAFYKYGRTPACVFGPIGGNLHAPDEWVDIESLEKATHAFVLMIKNWCH